MSYYDIAITEIVYAKSLKGYAKAIKYMLNHELGKEPSQVGRTRVIKMVKKLSQVHTALKAWHPERNREMNKRIAEEAYEKICDEFIHNGADDELPPNDY